MSYQGNTIQLKHLENGIIEMHFNNQGESVNIFNRETLKEMDEALDVLSADTSLKGVLITSGKSVFIAGADITEFVDLFKEDEAAIIDNLASSNRIFNKLEDLHVPTVAAINGAAMGGGLELALACDMRVASESASLGLPEVQLGIIPGFGGTVRLPRIIGIDNAVEWIATGRHNKAASALAVGTVDAVVAAEQLHDAGLAMLKDCIDGRLDIHVRREEKTSAVKLNDTERLMAFMTGKSMVASQAGKNFLAPMTAVKAMEKHCTLKRDDALVVESEHFASVAKTPVAQSLVGLFLNDQYIGKVARKYGKAGDKITSAAVLGAGIMGGGIAYQSAYKGVPIYMKDIVQKGLDQGMEEASKLLSKQVERGRMTAQKMGAVLSDIHPTLSYEGIDGVDIVVEAVVENLKVKQKVLADVESKVKEGTIIASNTSTISITRMAESLKRPEHFCGMHFFNPVHRMPLVEVIRGEKTDEKAVATVVNYALAMGKKPIVVNDCAGFFVNRVLFPYFYGFELLLRDGVDYKRIDKVMEKFGWPMGPAYLGDVVGLDTCQHAGAVMAEAFPSRMPFTENGGIGKQYAAERYGQKNGKGFYRYETDKRGRLQKLIDEEGEALSKSVAERSIDISDEEIIDRMMIPMANEVIRCLDEQIVASAAEADMGLIYGLGFPLFRGGICRYIDQMGAALYVAKADALKELGEVYQVTDSIREMAAKDAKFFA